MNGRPHRGYGGWGPWGGGGYYGAWLRRLGLWPRRMAVALLSDNL